MSYKQVDHAAVAASTSAVSLVGENLSRKDIEFDNSTSPSNLYAKVGGTATLVDYTWMIPALSIRLKETTDPRAITGIWTSASGSVKITEGV